MKSLPHPVQTALRRRARTTPSRPFLGVAAACAAILWTTPAFGLDRDALTIDLFASDRYDSNLFRLPDGQQPFGDQQRSATTRTTGVGLHFDQLYGLQRFDLSGNVTHVSYSPYHFLDATTRSLAGTWNWTLTPEVTGTISIMRSEAPNNFSDVGQTTGPNVRKIEDRRFDIDWRPGAAIHPRLSFLQDEDKSQQTTFNRENSRTSSLEGALVYEFRSGNTAQAYFRRGKGNYEDVTTDATFQSDSRFDEHETGLAAHYVSNGFSSFDAKVGYLSREHRTFSSRNFSGAVGQITYTYVATGKTQVQLQASRALNSSQSFVSSYSSDEVLSINPSWAATSKISVRPNYSLTRRSFRGALVPVADNLVMTMRDASLNVDWNAYRGLLLSFSVTKENRSSNDRTFQFSDHGAGINVSYRF